ncbi:MAG: tRNA glutamyl-Q(34) synthetase GluQRS [Baekduia sp.]
MASGAGRYAPSPSGPLHVGNLRTALLAWLSARSQGLDFALRIDDLDRARCRAEHERSQLEDLSALGLVHDGTPLRQSERSAAYTAAIAELEAQDLIYRCWCTRAEIREAASAPHGATDRYPGTCRELTAAQRSERERSGRPPALRIDSGSAKLGFTDRHHGPQQQIADDVVVRRNDGTHGYQLATVVDDHAQAVTEVVRGDDLLPSTAAQLWLIDRLGLARPTYAHVPLVLNSTGTRLAKREGAVTLAERRALGETPEDVLGMLAASVGLWESGRPATAGELLDRYDPASFTPPPSGQLPL